MFLENKKMSPGQVAQLVTVSSQYAKVMGSIPGQGIYKKQPMNAQISETNKSVSLSLSLPVSL